MDRNKHKAVILMTIEVHEVLKNGECSGNPVKTAELQKYNILPKQVISVEGENKDLCLKKLAEKIDEFKSK